MKIYTRLTLGVGTLFVIIVFILALSAGQISVLSLRTENILKDNYLSLQYTQEMLRNLEHLPASPDRINTLDSLLAKQILNITEPGEKEVTYQLGVILKGVHNTKKITERTKTKIRNCIYKIQLLNMLALQRKSELAIVSAGNAASWIAIAGTICFILSFTLLLNLPSSIAAPIRQLTARIREIGNKNYEQRIYLKDSPEFKEVSQAFNQMASQLEMFEGSSLAQLISDKKRIEALLNHISDPVFGLNAEYRLIFYNTAAAHILGISENMDTYGKNLSEVPTSDLLSHLITGISDTEIKSLSPISIVLNGKEHFYSRNITPVYSNEEGEKIFSGYVIRLMDITRFQQKDVARDYFIATISHELKTPLASIKMSTDLLSKDKVSPITQEQLELVEGIQSDVNRLLSITSELLKISQIESGNISLELQNTPLNQLLYHALEAVKRQLDNKSVKVELQIPDPLISIIADPDKSAWVLVNILSNAIRYSPENGLLTIQVTDKPGFIGINIQDQGPGISPEFQARVFDRYFQVPGVQSGGSGLGLSIGKEFMAAQGGNIELISRPGEGATFTVWFQQSPQQ